MNTIFLNSGKSKISDLHILLLSYSDKIKLKGSDRYVLLSNLRINFIHGTVYKSHTKQSI